MCKRKNVKRTMRRRTMSKRTMCTHITRLLFYFFFFFLELSCSSVFFFGCDQGGWHPRLLIGFSIPLKLLTRLPCSEISQRQRYKIVKQASGPKKKSRGAISKQLKIVHSCWGWVWGGVRGIWWMGCLRIHACETR